jgi:DNA-binding response OmpR family regulator
VTAERTFTVERFGDVGSATDGGGNVVARYKVLTVDDDDAIRCLVRENLELSGFEVIEAADGEAALRAVAAEKPDLVILDVKMPGMDGWNVLRTLRTDPATATLPVVMLTVLADDANVARGWGIGADFYLTKPFEPLELVQVVTRLLCADRGNDTSR